MKKYIKNVLKNVKVLYLIYFYLFSCFLKFLGLFIKVDDNLVLFVSYGGKKYDDSPKVIYEYMKKTEKYKKFKFVWGFIEPNKYDIDENDKVKIDTIKYYIVALKAKYWITNSSVERGLNFKRKENIYVLFMHGLTAIKKSTKKFISKGKQFKMKKPEKFDKVFIEGKKEKELVLQNINVDEKNLYNYGLPRCDELIEISKNKFKIEKIKAKLGINTYKKIILYAPTYREFRKNAKMESITKVKLDMNRLKKELSDEYIFISTAHYETGKLLNIKFDNKFSYNAFNYNSINELLAISDILISDYSNIVFDYTILEKPIICYGFDYEDFIKKGRDSYTDLNKLFLGGVIKTEESLIKTLKNINYEEYCLHSKKIREEYIKNYGNATQKCVEEIFSY